MADKKTESCETFESARIRKPVCTQTDENGISSVNEVPSKFLAQLFSATTGKPQAAAAAGCRPDAARAFFESPSTRRENISLASSCHLERRQQKLESIDIIIIGSSNSSTDLTKQVQIVTFSYLFPHNRGS